METESGGSKTATPPLPAQLSDAAPRPSDTGGLDPAAQKRRVEELILWGSWERAREELLKIRTSLQGDPRLTLELELIDRRIKEVSELSQMTDTRLRDHLERGQFYFNNFEYSAAVRLWLSDPELSQAEEVKARIAFAQGLIERLEAEIAKVRVHLDHGDPEAALAALAAVKNLDTKRSRLWSLERNAQNLLNQKRVDALKGQVLDLLGKGDYEGGVTLLAWIAELSQHISTVRWLRRIREETVQRLVPEFGKCLGAKEVPKAEKIYRWVQRLNSEGAFDAEVDRLRRELGGLPPGTPGAESPLLPLVADLPTPLPFSLPPGSIPAPRRRLRVSWSFLAGATVTLLLFAFLVHQVLGLFHLRSAERLAQEEKWEAAAEEVDAARGLLIGGWRLRALRKEVALKCALERARDSLRLRSWARVEDAILAAREGAAGMEGLDKEIEAVMAQWRKALLTLAQNGEGPECCAGFDRLEKFEKSQAEIRALEAGRYSLALQLAKNLLSRARFPEAIAFTRRAQASPASTAEPVELLGEIRGRMIEAAQERLTEGKFDEAQALYRLLESQFPEIPTDREAHFRRLEFFKAVQAGKNALASWDLREAEAALQRALDLRPQDGDAGKKLDELRAELTKLRRRSGIHGETPGASARADLAEAASIAVQGYRIRIPGELTEVLGGSIYGNNLRGTWTLRRDSTAALTLLLEGRITLAAGDWISPMGDIRIAVLYRNDRGEAVAGQVVRIPLLLPGAGQDFQFRLPAAGEGTIQVGVATP